MATKSEQAQSIYQQVVDANPGEGKEIKKVHKETCISRFIAELQMTEKGASTYFYNCARVAAGGVFNVAPTGQGRQPKEPDDTSPGKDDNRTLYTVVTPEDSADGKHIIVGSTHSVYHAEIAIRMAKFDQFVVVGLPEIGDDVDQLTRYVPQ